MSFRLAFTIGLYKMNPIGETVQKSTSESFAIEDFSFTGYRVPQHLVEDVFTDAGQKSKQ